MKVRKNSLRAFACTVAACISVLSISFAFDTNASTDSSSFRVYKRYNATTGAYLGDYSLTTNFSTNSDSDSDSINTVIGDDDRVVDFTKSGVVKLMTSNNYVGTGFVVDDHTIATAAHCVKGYKISAIRLFDTDGNIEQTATPVETHIPQKYIANAQDSVNYDYALITVSEDLSAYEMFDLGVSLDTAIDNNTAVSVTGFPKYINNDYENEVNNYTINNMYTGNGVLKYRDDTTLVINSETKTFYKDSALFYTTDSSGGNSGGPVYVTTSYYGEVYYTVIGIHNYGLGSINLNSATRMTPELLRFYLSNPNT